MSMHGSLSIEKRSIRWSRADLDAYLMAASVGVLAGLAVSFLRTPLHLPGHKVLLWMTPILAARLATRARGGATAGVLLLVVTTLLLGGQLGGGALMMPLVVVAGIALDAAAGWIERNHVAFWRVILLLAAAGVAGNLICFIKRLFEPVGEIFSTGNLSDLVYAGASHAAFGLVAGICGAICGWAILKTRSGPISRAESVPSA